MDNDELAQLASLQLRNAFYLDFSALVARYLGAGHNLGIPDHERKMQFGDLADVYSVAPLSQCPYMASPKITTDDDVNPHPTIATALGRPRATCVYINNRVAFKRNPAGEWILIDLTASQR